MSNTQNDTARPSMLTLPRPIADFQSVRSLGSAQAVQELSAMAAAKTLAQSTTAADKDNQNKRRRKIKKRRKRKKTVDEILRAVGDKFSEEKAKLEQIVGDLKSKSASGAQSMLSQIVEPHERKKQAVESEQMLVKLEEVFDILSEEPFRSTYDYYATNLPGLSFGGPDGTPETLPVDYFDQLSVPPAEQSNENQSTAPGQFVVGQEEQWNEAVRDLYQGMIDRTHELWQGLQAALIDSETWSAWARSWITQPLVINKQEAVALVAALKLCLEKLCTGNSSQDVCRARARQRKFDSQNRAQGMSSDLNQLWSEHCGPSPTTQKSFEGSLLCDLGRGSSMALLLARVRMTPLNRSVINDARGDTLIVLLNAVLGGLLSEVQYYDELIADMDNGVTRKTPEHESELEELRKKRQLALSKETQNNQQKNSASGFAKIAQAVQNKLQGLAKAQVVEKIQEVKQERFNGAQFSLKDLDWLADRLDTVVQFDLARDAINTQLGAYGLQV